jgi:hypothetical protein
VCAAARGRGGRRRGDGSGGCGGVLRGEVTREHVSIVLSCQICEGRILLDLLRGENIL